MVNLVMEKINVVSSPLETYARSVSLNTPETFQYSASRAFNCLPLNIRSCNEFNAFNNTLRGHFRAKAVERVQYWSDFSSFINF